MMMKRDTAGFTLIELIVAVAIVAILAAIAYPSYTEQVRSSRRAEGITGLLELSQFMERVLTENGTYQPGGSNPTLPASPSGSNSYTYSLTAATTGSTYTLQAVPKGGQSGDRCGTLTLDHAGIKQVSSSTVATCWKSS
jgi:type IV pilus assembly protein PilE